MNHAKLRGIGFLKLGPERGVAIQEIGLSKEQGVLGIPPRHGLVLPDALANAVDRNVAVFPKERCPFVRPLFIEMKVPALKWNRG